MTKRGFVMEFSREFKRQRSPALFISDLVRDHLPPDSFTLEEFDSSFDLFIRDAVWIKLRVVDHDIPWLPPISEGSTYPMWRDDMVPRAIAAGDWRVA